MMSWQCHVCCSAVERFGHRRARPKERREEEEGARGSRDSPRERRTKLTVAMEPEKREMQTTLGWRHT